MQKHTLKVEPRDVVGKKVKKLRKQGLLPGNVYGKGVTSAAVQVNLKDFEATYKETGETGLVELHIGSDVRPVLIQNVQLDYTTQQPIHADFYQVNLKEKVKAMVPVVLVGEPKAVSDKLGLLLQTLNGIEVEALPTDLPENFEVNVENLAAVNDQIAVGDLKASQGVEILSDKEQVVAKIGELVSKATEEELAAEAAAAEEAKTEGAEGAPATGEATPATGETETKPEEPAKE